MSSIYVGRVMLADCQSVYAIVRVILESTPVVVGHTIAVVEGKTQGLDEMQKSAGGKTGAPDIAGIPVYFGRYQNNMAFKFLAQVI